MTQVVTQGKARQGKSRQRSREGARANPAEPDAALHSLAPPLSSKSTETDKIMAVVDPVFEELLEKEGDEKRGLWRVENLELVPVPEG